MIANSPHLEAELSLRFYFARHGESVANLLHVFSNQPGKHPLTEQGQQQAKDLAQRMTSLGLLAIYSSPVLRALQTAQIVQQVVGVPLHISDALREYSVGSFEDTDNEENWHIFFDRMHEWMEGRNRQLAVGGGENFFDLRNRFVPFVEGLKAKFAHQEGGLLLVGHGGTFRCMLPLVLSNLSFDWIRQTRFANGEVVTAELRAGNLVGLTWGDQLLPQEVL
jgi:broad specificity phosphatase PhoE